MPPKKKNTDKKPDAASSAATPGSASDQAGGGHDGELDENEIVNHEQMIEDFIQPSTIAMETLSDIFDIAMNRIASTHVKSHTDAFAASAACEAITDLADWLYLTCEDAAELCDFEEMYEPSQIGIDSWAESAANQEKGVFMACKKDEVVDLFCKQRTVADQSGIVHQAILPDWLKVNQRPQSSIALTSISTTPSVKQASKKKARTRSTLSSKASTKNNEQVQLSTTSPTQPTKPSDSGDKGQDGPMVKKLSAGRMRQFKRRSEQHKAQKAQKQQQQKMTKPRLEPIPKHQTNPVPMVQIVDPNVEAFEARRKALKIGKIRPQTESETVFVRGNKHQQNNKNKKSHAPQKPPIQRINPKNSNISHHSIPPPVASHDNISPRHHPGALPETLVDSLAIADGRKVGRGGSAVLAEEFDTLKPVSITST